MVGRQGHEFALPRLARRDSARARARARRRLRARGLERAVQARAGRRGLRVDAGGGRHAGDGARRRGRDLARRRRARLARDRPHGHRQRLRPHRLLRAPAARLRDRRPLARLPAGARHGADLGDGRRDRDARRAPGPARARGHRGDRRRRRPAAGHARDRPRPRTRLRAADRPADRHLHDLGRARACARRTPSRCSTS